MIKIRELNIFDLHIPRVNWDAFDAMVDYVAGVGNIDHLVLGGDLVDFQSISPWGNCANVQLDEERELTENALDIITKAFPNARKTFIVGNHDLWLERHLCKLNPQLLKLPELSLASVLRLDEFGFEVVDNVKLLEAGKPAFKIGNLTHLHGHELRISPRAKHVAHLAWDRCADNVIFGHFHTDQTCIKRGIRQDAKGAWAIGTMGELSPEFRPINDWVNGFAIVEHFDGQFFSVYNKKIINHKVV